MRSSFVVAIDGPVASGKGTIAPLLANRLSGFHLYTGAVYRALALYCLEHGVDLSLTDDVARAAQTMAKEIRLEDGRIYLEDIDVTERIKARDVADLSSVVAIDARVREVMTALFQKIATDKLSKGQVVVAEGRDTAIVVFPDAPFRLYLTASVEVRAKRRFVQMQDTESDIDYETVFEDTKERDRRDLERAASPLAVDPHNLGYFVVDNSDLSEEETLNVIVREMKKEGLL